MTITWKLASSCDARTTKQAANSVSDAGVDGKEMFNARALGLSVLQFRAF
jgi:hypothetical protein